MEINEKIRELINSSFLNVKDALEIQENKELIEEIFKNIFLQSFHILSLKSITSQDIEKYIFYDEFKSQVKSNKILLNFKIIKGVDFKYFFEDNIIKIENIEENKYYSINELKENLKLNFIVDSNNVSFKSKFNFIKNED